ncbi:hypothetical protein [Streptococcus pneumoniae]|nr:hypothetical protein [Streptococcus pneumoniae]
MGYIVNGNWVTVGLFKEIRKRLQLSNVENGDLVYISDDNDEM